MSTAWKVIIAVILAVVLVAGWSYYYLNQENRKAEEEKTELQSQIDELEIQIDILKNDANRSEDGASQVLDDEGISGQTTYSNNEYGFKFDYSSDWNILEISQDYGDARKYLISLNTDNGTTTEDSIFVQVFDMGGLVTLNFINSYFSEWEGGPSGLKTATVNSQPVIEFIMEKANAVQYVSSGHIMFTYNPSAEIAIGVDISTSSKTGNVLSDVMLNQIANTFSFTQ